jgi:hypothetical protein
VTSTATSARGGALRRFSLALAIGASLWGCIACGGDDDGAGDDAAACQQMCDAEYADEAEGCTACSVASTFEDGVCSCEFLACVQDLCVQYCETQDAGAASALCYLDACACG